ncbi:MAG: ABC transporter permease [Terriglobales bacterium]
MTASPRRARWLLSAILLGLGIGACATGFALYYDVLERPLPYKNPSSLVSLWRISPPSYGISSVSYPDFEAWRRRTRGKVGTGLSTLLPEVLTGVGPARQVNVMSATANFLSLLGVTPVLGRSFTGADRTPGAEGGGDAAIISFGFWRSVFAASPDAVGRHIRLDGALYTIVGVLPRRFWFYDPTIPIWTTLAHFRVVPPGKSNVPVTSIPAARFFMGVGRRKESLARLRDRMNAVAAQLRRNDPSWGKAGIRVVPLSQWWFGPNRGLFIMLMLIGGAVFLLAFADVATLVLASAVGRRPEFAMRSAIGAAPRHIAAQVLRELAPLAAVSGGLGIAGAFFTTRSLAHWVTEYTGRPSVTFGKGAAALAGAVAVMATLLLAGLVLWQALRSAERPSTGGQPDLRHISPGLRVTWATILAVQVTLATALLGSSALLWRSSRNLLNRNPGFRPAGILSFRVDLPQYQYSFGEAALTFHDLLQRLRRGPGVLSAGAVTTLPLGGNCCAATDGRVLTPGRRPFSVADVRMEAVSPGYFKTMGIPVLAGRAFIEADGRGAPAAAIVSRSFARAYGAGLTSLVLPGKGQTNAVWTGRRVVGIVGDVVLRSLRESFRPTVYFPAAQIPFRAMTIVVRAAPGRLAGLGGFARRQLAVVAPGVPATRMATMRSDIRTASSRERFFAGAVIWATGLALVLAVVGLYGVVAWLVSQRSRDVAIRFSLGAPPTAVLWSVARTYLIAVGAGIAIGVVAFAVSGKLLAGLLFGVSPGDPLTAAATAVFLGVTAATAVWLAFRRISPGDLARLLRVP